MASLPIRQDLNAAELRALARKESDARVLRRLLALAMALDGADREEAARQAGMDRQTLRDWVVRYNAEGVDGLRDRERPGRPALLAPELEEELRQLIEAGPNLERDGVVEYRVRHIRELALQHFGADYSRSGMQGRLHHMKLSYLKPRPIRRPRKRLKNFTGIIEEIRSTHPEATALEVWFQDGAEGPHARVGQKGTLTRRWAPCGSRPRAIRDHRFKSAYLFGAVCPDRDLGIAVVLSRASSEAMDIMLAELSQAVAPGAHAAVLIDGAGYHIAGDLTVPNNITLVRLPSYSPELNAIEKLWQFMRENILSHRLFDSLDHIIDVCCDAWNRILAEPGRIRSTCGYPWASQVKT